MSDRDRDEGGMRDRERDEGEGGMREMEGGIKEYEYTDITSTHYCITMM